ncbi:MAG: class I SAM-dependent methyltransferase [Patescibacteria group bacterium]
MTISESVYAIQKKYRGLGWPSLFVKLKFFAAPFVRIIPLVPEEGTIIDLGCGYGILSNMLGMLSEKRRVFGIDCDESKIRTADRGVTNVSFYCADITTSDISRSDCIVIVHVFHHLPSYAAQEEMLRACVGRLEPGGKLIITEVDKLPRWKYALSWIADHLLYPKDTITFRSQSDWLSLFSLFPLDVESIPMHQGALFPHITFVAKKSILLHS